MRGHGDAVRGSVPRLTPSRHESVARAPGTFEGVRLVSSVMKFSATTRLLLPLGATALLVASATAQRPYCSTLGGQLYELDLAAQVATPVAGTGVNLLFGIANLSSPTELLISGVTAGRFHVDLATGVATPLSGGTLPMFALCNNEDNGKVYAASLGNLYEIDAASGAETLVGATGLPNIWGVDYVPRLSSFVAHEPISNQLYSLDPTTGSSTLIGPTNMDGLVAIWYDLVGDTLYGVCDANNGGCVVELDLTTGAATALFSTGMNLVGIGGDVGGGGPQTIGTSYCSAVANSTGAPAILSAVGSEAVATNDVTLTCTGLPPSSFGYFLSGTVQGLVMGPGGSQGNLCVGGNVGRFNRAAFGEIQNSGPSGEFSLTIDLSNMPTPTGAEALVPGDTRTFQCWYRDANPAATSNFSDGVEITFL